MVSLLIQENFLNPVPQIAVRIRGGIHFFDEFTMINVCFLFSAALVCL